MANKLKTPPADAGVIDDITLGQDVAANDLFPWGNGVLYAPNGGSNGDTRVVGYHSCVAEIKATTANTGNSGDPWYWDNTAKEVTTVSTGNTLVGPQAQASKANGDTKVLVAINAPRGA